MANLASLVNEIKNMDLDTADVDAEIFVLAVAEVAAAKYASFKAEPPEWLPLRIKQLDRDIKSKRQALVEKRIRELQSRKAALLPREKKIDAIDSELESLLKQVE